MNKFFFLTILCITLSGNLKSQDITHHTDSGFVEVEDGRLFYEAAGDGENIVLLHDGMVHREIWDEQFREFAKSYRVVRYDRRSFGKSTDPQKPYSDIEDLNQLYNQLKIDQSILFGMSSGGGLAIDFTLKYPEKVTGLVLVGAVVSGYGYSPHMTTRGGNIKSFEMFSDPLKVVQYFVMEDPYEIYSGNVKVKDRVMQLMLNNLHHKAGNVLPPERPAARFLSEIKVPVLVIVGEYDIPDVHSHAGVIQFGIPNAKREAILKSGHLVPMEQPEAFNNCVIGFLCNTKFYSLLNTKDVESATQYFHFMHQKYKSVFLKQFELNVLGYKYLDEGKIEDAISLFKLNVFLFPDSYNVFDSLGEAYMKNGQTELAIKNYEQSLKLDPENQNAIEILKKLR